MTVHECSYCGKRGRRSHILEHERIHTGEKPFSCQYCDRKFTTNSAKTSHERTRHNAEKPFSCEYCDKKFASKSQKTSHERTHMEKLKIEIDDIKNEFPGGTVMESADSRSIEIGEGSQSNLPISKDEIKVNTSNDGENLQPYKCKECFCSFAKISDAQIHFESAHVMKKEADSDSLTIKLESDDVEIKNEPIFEIDNNATTRTCNMIYKKTIF